MVDTSPYVNGPFSAYVYQLTFCTMVDTEDPLQTITGMLPDVKSYSFCSSCVLSEKCFIMFYIFSFPPDVYVGT